MSRLPALPGRPLLACDFLETVTLSGARLCIFAVIEQAGRRVRVLRRDRADYRGPDDTGSEELVMDREGADCRARLLIRDRDGKFPALFDTILADTGIEVVLGGVRIAQERDHGLDRLVIPGPSMPQGSHVSHSQLNRPPTNYERP
jgi:hypothetical protein